MASQGKGWTTVAFGDVVKLNKERAKDPLTEGLDRYVGLEHLEPGDLKLRRWGNVVDGTTFTNVFRPGQVLFGKRRAYQRKAAVADFRGVCSGDIYVFTPKDDRLLPELLPFICQADSFLDHAIGTSAGSLSPRTNWKSLASYEFALPPLEEQRRIAGAIAAVDGASDALTVVRHSCSDLIDSVFEFMTSTANDRSGTMADFCEFITDGDHNPPQRIETGVPHLVVANLKDGRIDDDGCTFISSADFERVSKRYRPKGGDVLLSGVGSIGEVALVPDRYTFSADRSLAIYRPDRDLLIPQYCYWLLRAGRSQRYFDAFATGTAQLHLYLGDLRRMPVSIPRLAEQSAVVAKLSEIESSRASAAARIEGLGEIRKAIDRTAFGSRI